MYDRQCCMNLKLKTEEQTDPSRWVGVVLSKLKVMDWMDCDR